MFFIVAMKALQHVKFSKTGQTYNILCLSWHIER